METISILLPLFTQYGYIAVFFMLLICGLGFPLPEDITLIAGGIIAGLGYVDEKIMLINCLAGVLLGDTIIFALGVVFGKQIKQFPWIAKLLNKERFELIKQKSAKYGHWILFVARFLPGLRAAIFCTAGISHRVKLWQFLLIDGIAAIISVPLWVYLGIYGARNLDHLIKWIRHGQIGVLLLVGLICILSIFIVRYEYKKHQKSTRKNGNSIDFKR